MNFSAFNVVPSDQEIKDYISAHQEQVRLSKHTTEPYITFHRGNKILYILLTCSVLMIIVAGIIESTFSMPGLHSVILGSTVLISIAIIAVLLVRLRSLNQRRRWLLGLQLERFAKDNGFRYARYQPYQNPEGLLDPHANIRPGGFIDSIVDNAIEIKNESITTPEFEVADVYFSVGKVSFNTAYIRIPLSRKLPRIILKKTSRKNRPPNCTVVKLPNKYDHNIQLYAASDGQELAQEIFTPDFLDFLKENNWISSEGVEIINESLYIYISVDWFNKEFWNGIQSIYLHTAQQVAVRGTFS